MAEGKKSFVLYAEYIEIFEELSDEDAGQLAKHLFRYVNDQNPETENPLAKLAFIPIKQQLKRDLKKYERTKEERSSAAVLGNLKRWHPDIYKRFNKGEITLQKALEIANDRKTSQSDKPIANVAVNEDVDVDDNVLPNGNYSEKEFLKDWNELRTKHLKKPSHLNRLSADDKENFEDLAKDYNPEEFQHALIGLFRQKKLPNDNTTMQSNPKHFLTHFNAYITAFYDKNDSLYGKEKTMQL